MNSLGKAEGIKHVDSCKLGDGKFFQWPTL